MQQIRLWQRLEKRGNIKKYIMKKLFLTLIVIPAIITGCRKNEGGNNVTLDKYTLEMRTGDVQTVYVVTGDPDNVSWGSRNEFVATVDRGRISGLRIGQAIVTANNASVAVTVRGRVDLYDEPLDNLRWGMTKEQVVSLLGVPAKIENNVLTYNLTSSVNSFKSYEFDPNNRLTVANITVNKDKTSQLEDFLGERYLLLDGGGSQDRDYINSLTYSTATIVVSRTSLDDSYWLVSYQQPK